MAHQDSDTHTLASESGDQTVIASPYGKPTPPSGPTSATASAGDLLAPQEIEYHYVDFDTSIPPLTHPAPADIPMPNLAEYTSPFEWSNTRKTAIMLWVVVFACFSSVAAGSYNAPMAELMKKWNVSHVVYELGVTLFCVGYAAAPMLLAPFSEITGRRWTLILCGIVFTSCTVATGGTHTFAGMLVARFFVGCGASVFSSLLGGIVSDMYPSEKSNIPMALFSSGAIFGIGFGPLVCGFIEARHSWRWVFYFQAIVEGVGTVYAFFFLKESRSSVLLSRKAATLNDWYEKLEKAGCVGVNLPIDPNHPKLGVRSARLRYKSQSDDKRQGLAKTLTMSVYRPFQLLVTEPVVFFFSLWISFAWGVLYLQICAIPLVYTERYGFDGSENGAVFSSMCIGSIIAVLITVGEVKYMHKYHPEQTKKPESSLYFACVESTLLPIGLFWFGWTCFSSVPWIVPTLAMGCATIGIFSIFLAVFNFLADCYGHYASSALAAQSFCRNIIGGVFALITRAMFNNMGFAAASSLLGGLGLALTLVPWALVWKGPEIRSRSKICSEIMRANEGDMSEKEQA